MKSYYSKNGDVSKKMHLHAYKRTHNAHKSINVNHNVDKEHIHNVNTSHIYHAHNIV
ncbi:hypothetical protein PFNF54_02425 [Plasmodium falciparum NF54]|uniref:Uncharacterized protein n=1 Tax=Plasmodium falciparum (isolate NF54) TaxID=5843 RepID=W7JVR9_PLAFO|nr:hypothetical protein PFNF54_02425 [Plasmodium falciparum NF54]